MTYEDYVNERVEIIRAWQAGEISWFAAKYRMMKVRMRWHNHEQLPLVK